MSFEVVFTDEANAQALQIQDWIAEKDLSKVPSRGKQRCSSP